MPSNLPYRQRPVRRRVSHRATPAHGPAHGRTRRRPLSLQVRLALTAIGSVLLLLAWGILARQLAPLSNADLSRFDTIIVLGVPADSDGNPTPVMLAHVTEAVREYQRGVAPRLIFTGAAAHNQFVEARVMARVAHAQGIPESAIYVDPEAMDTIQNACYSTRIMQAHGWHSAEVVSTARHLPRAAMIFSRMPIEWRMHAAPPLSPSAAYSAAATVVETLRTVRYLVWTRQTERCEP
ncbi:MAG: YdcF family protein [Terracidiphilus sp.]|nr:YdcF family protein [Terracidiphilus sp.]MDR3776529.1 YdcF family protein [Terracidiphilus sp.]